MSAAQQKRDYYEVLAVGRDGTAEQIKQAYRQLALKWHPDRNTAPDATDKFREIAEAYAVLSDPAKRQAYDATGHAGVSERWSTEDIFRDFDFGDLGGIFGDLFGGRRRRDPVRRRGTDLHCDLRVTLGEAAKVEERLIHLTRSDPCKSSGGNGAKAGTRPAACAECGGTGEKQQVRSDRGMKVVTLLSCSRCRGMGTFIEFPCPACSGTGVLFSPHAIKLRIPAGADHGMLLRIAGQGEAGPQGAPPGDLLVRVNIQPHPLLKRDGDDLYAAAQITFPQAALGTKVTVKYLDNENVLVTVPPGTQSGTLLRLRGKGMPRLHGKGKGDLFVVVEVKTPTALTGRQRELLREFAQLESERKKSAFASGSGTT